MEFYVCCDRAVAVAKDDDDEGQSYFIPCKTIAQPPPKYIIGFTSILRGPTQLADCLSSFLLVGFTAGGTLPEPYYVRPFRRPIRLDCLHVCHFV